MKVRQQQVPSNGKSGVDEKQLHLKRVNGIKKTKRHQQKDRPASTTSPPTKQQKAPKLVNERGPDQWKLPTHDTGPINVDDRDDTAATTPPTPPSSIASASSMSSEVVNSMETLASAFARGGDKRKFDNTSAYSDTIDVINPCPTSESLYDTVNKFQTIAKVDTAPVDGIKKGLAVVADQFDEDGYIKCLYK